ncbi:MAG: hypothetical protein E6K39_16285 [Gammaproteobacteria bacterium]|nr:MAG: hypothetical protein E6K39_16285 [Gammaproteobacteria bacterium]
MKVPYAKKWQNETDALRKTAVGCGLVEAVKWGKPCFTYQKKNVAIVIPLKETCALAFFKGALLKDPKRILKLQVRLNAAPRLKAAFEALTPGRRKSYLFHISTAKRAETRATRAEKCVPMILSGRGFNEFRRAPRRS